MEETDVFMEEPPDDFSQTKEIYGSPLRGVAVVAFPSMLSGEREEEKIDLPLQTESTLASNMAKKTIDPDMENMLSSYLDNMAAKRGVLGSIHIRPKLTWGQVPDLPPPDEESKVLGTAVEDFFNTTNTPNPPTIKVEDPEPKSKKQAMRKGWMNALKAGKEYTAPKTPPKRVFKQEPDATPSPDHIQTLIELIVKTAKTASTQKHPNPFQPSLTRSLNDKTALEDVFTQSSPSPSTFEKKCLADSETHLANSDPHFATPMTAASITHAHQDTWFDASAFESPEHRSPLPCLPKSPPNSILILITSPPTSTAANAQSSPVTAITSSKLSPRSPAFIPGSLSPSEASKESVKSSKPANKEEIWRVMFRQCSEIEVHSTLDRTG